MIVRNRKNKNFTIQFFFVFHSSKKFDKNFNSDDHAMRVLTIDNVEIDSVTFYFADKKEKVYSHCNYKINNKFEFTHERFKFYLLFFDECELFESHRKIEL